MLLTVSWTQIVQVMSASPAGHSKIDPFNAHDVPDFNFAFAVMATILNIYTALVLQNRQGFNAAARSPHESRMGGVLGQWRMYARTLMLLVLGICSLTFLKHADFAQQARSATDAIASIPDGYVRQQMSVPIALRYLLPTGVKGLFCAIMVMGLIAGDAAHMHSWGSIFVQDVLLPLRKNPMSQRQHIWVLRSAMIGVAAFALFFSLFFTQTQYIALWWAITAGMFTGGAGAAIVGGLYWRRGTTPAAWTAAITGSTLAFIGIILSSKAWQPISAWAGPLVGIELPQRFWLNNQKSAFLAAASAAIVYIVVSLATSRGRFFNLDQLLHRGQYADPDKVTTGTRALPVRERFRLGNLLKFDQNFTFADKLVAAGIFVWALLLLALNLIVSSWNILFHQWSLAWWSRYWLITSIAIPFAISFVTLIWFALGGLSDIRHFFIALRTATTDPTDDGRVVSPSSTSPEPHSSRAPTPLPASREAG